MKFKYQYLIITIVIAIVIFCNNCGKPKDTDNTKTERVFPVRVTKVERGDVESKIAYLGNLEPYKEVHVYSTIPARLKKLEVDVNDRVDEGDLLGVVDNIKTKQAVLQAEAGLKSVQAQFENMLIEWQRTKKLYEQKAVSKSQYDGVKAQKEAAEAAVNQMKAGLKSVKEQLNDTYIKAPISGIISMRTYNVGDQTSPQLPAFSIVQMEKIKINIDIVESQIALIKPGQKAYIYVDTYPDEVFSGKVDKKYPTIDPLTRTIKCEIIIDNADHRLKPGGFAHVEIVIDKHENVLIVPKHSIIEKTSLEYLGGEIRNTRIMTDQYVFVIKDSIAIMRKIQTELESDNIIEVLSGLAFEETIVTIGQYDLSDSSLVKIIDEGK